jgi:hypothetical protein
MTQQQPSPLICTLHAQVVWCNSPGCPGRETKRKLEAFGEMLEALVSCAQWLDAFGWNRHGLAVRSDFEDVEPVLKQARVAIAKSRGAQP